MANQRPINRRPFRRPPWRRSAAARPRKWIEANSHGSMALEFCTLETTNITCEPTTPRVLLAGDLDIEWADKDEVRVDRILGTVNVTSWYTFQSASPFVGEFYAPVIAFGLLAVEATDTLFQTIDLFDRESVEEYEWMWLERRQMVSDSQLGWNTENSDWVFNSCLSLSMDWDVKTRRTMGKKDSVVLYSQFGIPSNFALSGTLRTPAYHYELRSILRG